MANISQTFIPKFVLNANRENNDVITISTTYFSPQGDVYQIDKRTILPNVIQTTQSIAELSPEISSVYPFKIVPPKDFDGATLLQSPTIEFEPTASQNYYATLYSERYKEDVMRQISKEFTELTLG